MRFNAQTNMGWHRATSQGRNFYEEPERAKDPLGGPLKGTPFLTETHIGIAKKRPPLDHHRSTSSFLLTSRLPSEKQGHKKVTVYCGDCRKNGTCVYGQGLRERCKIFP
jgi:hypothetical protein